MSSVNLKEEVSASVRHFNTAPPDFNPETDLPAGFMAFLLPLHQELTSRQQLLARKRATVLSAAHQGQKPNYLPPSEATTSDWAIELPAWCADQRNQMTGPADDAELVVKMLNSGAPGVMLDLEDSMANFWSNLRLGIDNTVAALKGELTYSDVKRNRRVGINESGTVVFVRPRGLHISQAGVVGGELISASLFDVAMVAYQVEMDQLRHPLTFYIPKSESAEEALWWRDLFQAIENAKGLRRGDIKCMALVESHPIAYQMEEFIYNLREHIVGLNLGRWDYMASLIHFNLEDAEWVLPDRNTIPHDVPFFQNLRELLAETCHQHGILAIGGMTALFPSRTDPELNERALRVLAVDKKNEANCLMDGAWTGHPDQNEIAVQQFPFPNQLKARSEAAPKQPDLRPSPKGVGKITTDGTRAAIRTIIRYRRGVLNGKGASLLDGYMEDLATDRIYRLMIAQRIRHHVTIGPMDAGNDIEHTPESVSRMFDQELDRILSELPPDASDSTIQMYRAARHISESLIRNGEFDPI
jgi:malate synthase